MASPAPARHAASSSAPSRATSGTNRNGACVATTSFGNRAARSRTAPSALSRPLAYWYSRFAASASMCCRSRRSPSG